MGPARHVAGRLTLAAKALLATSCQSSPTPAPDAAAAAEVRRLVDAVCDWVSGPAGAPKDRNTLLALFVPEGQMFATATRNDGVHVVRQMPVGTFADLVIGEAQREPFYETSLCTRVDVFGGIAMAWSSYAARRAPDQPPFERGINSFQLVRTADGWRIVSVTWATESATLPLPAGMAGG